MASVISRNDKFCVVYSYFDKDGKRRQKWETFKTLGEANTRKIEIEYSQQVGNFVIPNCTTVSELMKEYVSLYGKTKWSPSVYSSNTGLINHYIEPYLGKLKLAEVTSHTLERYYQKLLTTPAVPMIWSATAVSAVLRSAARPSPPRPSATTGAHRLIRGRMITVQSPRPVSA